ncbi:helix-turn-helix domain-containing protein [Kibdelosporangium lantanae]|uniref:Helix-turn-helix domain-containing protein n=1 Tax=Kibdelosporangium lantanae TaxID=1497396 RepID=A0ABW3M3P1_9PSEU
MSQRPAAAFDARRQLVSQLRMLREKVGLTQDELAVALGGSRFQVSRIERGRLPTAPELHAVLGALGVDADAQVPYIKLWERAWQPGRIRQGRLGVHRADARTSPASTT